MASCPGNSIMHYHAFANTDVCWNTVHAAGERWAEWLTQWNWSLPSLTGRNQARSQVTANLKWGQEYFEVVTALTGDLTLRDATKPFNFLTFPDIKKESSWWVIDINGVLNPVCCCCDSCLSFSYSESKENYQANSGEETAWLHSTTIFIIRPQPLLHGEVLCVFVLCVSIGGDRNNYLASTLAEQAGFL